MAYSSAEFLSNVIFHQSDSKLRNFLLPFSILPMLFLKGTKAKAIETKGLYHKMGLVYGASGAVQKIMVGNEPLVFTRAAHSKHMLFKTGLARLTGSPVTALELAQWKNTNPEQVAVNSIEENTENYEQLFWRALEQWVLTGTVPAGFNAANFNQWATWNGEYSTSSSGVVGVTSGLLDALAPAAQTNTVQGLAKSTSYYYFNQHLHSSGFLGDSMDAIQRTAQACRLRSMTASGPSLSIMDLESFNRYQNRNLNRTFILAERGSAPRDKQTDSIDTTKLELVDPQTGIRFMASMYLETTAFSGNGQYGMTYLITPEELIVAPQGDLANFKGDRTDGKKGGWQMVEPTPGVEAMVPVKFIEFQHGIRNLASQGVVTGTKL